MTGSTSNMSETRSRRSRPIWQASTKRLSRAQSLLQDGVIRQLEIIGEAVKRLAPKTRGLAAQIPWSAIAGMRDKLIHDYFGVDLDQVWLTVTADLPNLEIAVTNILVLLGPDQGDAPEDWERSSSGSSG